MAQTELVHTARGRSLWPLTSGAGWWVACRSPDASGRDWDGPSQLSPILLNVVGVTVFELAGTVTQRSLFP